MFRHMPRMARLALASLLLLVTGALAAYAPAVAAAVQAPDYGYVALGDSFSSGVGAPPYISPDPDRCRRSEPSYPRLYAALNGYEPFGFAACSGATTTDVINTQLGYLSPATKVVTITIGGNDLHFSDGLKKCLFGTDARCHEVAQTALAAIRTTLLPNLDATYAAIRAKAPNAAVIVLGYPPLFEVSLTCPIMNDYRTWLLNDVATALNTAIEARAGKAKFRFIEVDSYFLPHRVCSTDPWIHTVTPTIFDSFHPTETGYVEGYLAALVASSGARP